MTKKFKVLTLSDHPLVPSGVGIQTQYIIRGLLSTGKYQFRSLGGAISHKDYRPQRLQEYGDDWIIFPIDGYGDENILRSLLDAEKPDAVWFMTDPRFYGWLFNMSDEIRDRGIPLLYYHVWDNYPVPDFNKGYYKSCDFVGCISKLTHDILKKLDMENDSAYIPHAVDHDIFAPLDVESRIQKRAEFLGPHKDKFVVFYNSRNARRKMTSDILKDYKRFAKQVGEDKTFLLMHTDPFDREGANLIKVAEMLKLGPEQITFSKNRLPPEQIALMYQMADVTVNISNNEGFGLSCLESLSCGTLVVVNKTGGLKDQPIDDEGNVFGAIVEPATRTLTGSQDIPYIFDDRCADDDIIAALVAIFDMNKEERSKLETKAVEWTRKQFPISKMVKLWDEALMKYISMFKEQGYKDRINFTRI